jgi:hypothetical protein
MQSLLLHAPAEQRLVLPCMCAFMFCLLHVPSTTTLRQCLRRQRRKICLPALHLRALLSQLDGVDAACSWSAQPLGSENLTKYGAQEQCFGYGTHRRPFLSSYEY